MSLLLLFFYYSTQAYSLPGNFSGDVIYIAI